jgi:hypothetical protein
MIFCPIFALLAKNIHICGEKDNKWHGRANKSRPIFGQRDNVGFF